MKKIILLIPFIAFMYVANAQTGLTGCYSLDNNANDLSGNNYNGTAFNVTPASDRFGHINSACHFSGAGSYISIPYAGYILNEYTYSVWCRATSIPAAGTAYCLIAIGGSVADQAIQIVNDPGAGVQAVGTVAYDANAVAHGCRWNFLPIVNQWYHLVMTRNNTTVNFYINDTLACSSTYTTSNAGYLNAPPSATIGSRLSSNFQNFEGDIDDVEIFSCALTLSQIQNLSTNCDISGIENLTVKTNLHIYPNPAIDNLTIESNTTATSFALYDITGKLLMQEAINTKRFEINLSNYSSGIYFLTVADKDNQVHRKIVKE